MTHDVRWLTKSYRAILPSLNNSLLKSNCGPRAGSARAATLTRRVKDRRDRMLLMGHSPTFQRACSMSALPSEADIGAVFRHVSYVPEGDLVLMVGSAQTRAPKL
jgi:hypothetical protein